jgi:hypothetical protein
MTQIRISDSSELEIAPTTWDGEPLYSPATVQEGLFASEAFKQMPGQTSMETDNKQLLEEIDNSASAVEARKAMFRGFGWGVS